MSTQPKKQPRPSWSSYLREISSKDCNAQLKGLLVQGLKEQLKQQISLLHQKAEQQAPRSNSTSQIHSPEPELSLTPAEEESALWQSIDDLETNIIEHKEVVVHYKSIVECLDDEADDLERVLEVKKEVCAELDCKIRDARAKLRTKALSKQRCKPSPQQITKSFSTINTSDTNLSEKSWRNSFGSSFFHGLWK